VDPRSNQLGRFWQFRHQRRNRTRSAGHHFSIGGESPISRRKHDTFGLAYYYLGFSDDFKDVARVVTPVRDERGLEMFYNVGLTPWLHITPDLQVITPILGAAETSVVLGLRMKVDF
jgi:porin